MKEEKTFEDSLKELEKVAQELERGDLSLEDALKNFEKGIKLSKECNKKLENAEKKINILIENANNELEEEPFSEE